MDMLLIVLSLLISVARCQLPEMRLTPQEQTDPLIDTVRNDFLDLANQTPNRFHPKDVQTIRNNTWWVERFIKVYKTYKEAHERLVTTMEWRKAFGIHNFDRANFPEHIIKSGVVSFYPQRDREGRIILYINVAHVTKSAPVDLVAFYIMTLMEMADRATSHEGWGLIFDLSDASTDNLRMDMFRFLTDVLQNHYPRGPKYLTFIDMPLVLRSSIYILIQVFSTELRKTVKFIGKSYLAEFLTSVQN